MNQAYRVGIYCRVSKDDDSNSSKAKNYIPADESVSIENQREMLSKFVMLNGWIETRTYTDDGYSGGNFNRPGFQSMLEDARNGVINMVLVRDLSRLGREFVEVGRYTTEVFPSLGVRFVSVLDCLDTDGDTDMLHFRSLMNDYHLRDLSKKIKSVLHSKKANGQFTSSYAPYGYRKSNVDKHKLVIDENTAPVVRRIFEMRLSGDSYNRIAAVMNQDGILSPRAYWNQAHGKDSKTPLVWKTAVVKKILHNEVYCGTLVMNHCGTRSYKDKTRIEKPECEHLRFEGNHEAIVPPDMWQSVQSINQEVKDRYQGREIPTDKLFTGKLICSGCKKPMNANTETHRRKDGSIRKYVSYHCSTHSRTGGACCSWHTIYEMTLVEIIREEIQAQAKALTLDEEAVIAKLKLRVLSKTEERTADTRKELSRLRRRVEELEDMTARLYEDKISGTIDAGTFAALIGRYEQERLEKSERLEMLEQEIRSAERENAAISEWTERIRKYMDLHQIDREIIDELIDHIEIGEREVVDGQRRQSVKIFYRFVGLLD